MRDYFARLSRFTHEFVTPLLFMLVIALFALNLLEGDGVGILSASAQILNPSSMDSAVKVTYDAFDWSVMENGFATGIGITAGAAFIGVLFTVVLKPFVRSVAATVLEVSNGSQAKKRK